MLTCTTVLKVKEDDREPFEHLLTKLVENVRAKEPGTTLFQFFRSRSASLTYLVVEQYVDDDALAEHSKSDYLQATVPEMLTYLSEPPKLDSFDLIT